MANPHPQRTTVTAALLYANGPVHIGHLGGCYLPADIYVRYLRSTGQQVLFVSGSDEHGVAITMKARQRGESPQQTIDHYHPIIEQAFRDIGISFDVYSRTSKPVHHETAQEFFRRFYERRDTLGVGFEEKTTEQFFDPEAGVFLADRYIQGTCPVCGYPRAYGDQCENCGSTLSPDMLIGPRNAMTGGALLKRPTKHWFLRLDAYQPLLQQFVQYHAADWKPNVYGQATAWLHEGLQPRSMTRDMDWGIDVPIEGQAGKKLYVWFDAPIGYISATKDWAQQQGTPDAWQQWWLRQPPITPDNVADAITAGNDRQTTRLVHFIGKDNIVFHTLIFPAMLMGHGDYLLPDNVPANEFVNLEGQKISTSRNWAVWLHEYVADFHDIAGGLDMLRYVMTAIAPEAKDSDFSWKDFQQRVNSELVAVLGNYVHRVLTLVQKYYGGVVPEPGPATDGDTALRAEVHQHTDALGMALAAFRFKEGLERMMDVARAGNKYLADHQPWHLVKTDPDRTRTVLFEALQVVAHLALVAEPFLPFTARQLRTLLGAAAGLDRWAALRQNTPLVPPGTQLPPPTLLFQKLEDDVVEAQIAKLQAAAAASGTPPEVPAAAPQAPQAKPAAAAAPGAVPALRDTIQYDDFAKLDIRVATVTAAECVAGADKLLRLTLHTALPDDADGQRTVVSGIAEHFAPEAVVGQRVLLLANLAPRKLRGTLSQGMILMAEDHATGKLVFVAPQDDAPDGSSVR